VSASGIRFKEGDVRRVGGDIFGSIELKTEGMVKCSVRGWMMGGLYGVEQRSSGVADSEIADCRLFSRPKLGNKQT
jgi:hypothetical protein